MTEKVYYNHCYNCYKLIDDEETYFGIDSSWNGRKWEDVITLCSKCKNNNLKQAFDYYQHLMPLRCGKWVIVEKVSWILK